MRKFLRILLPVVMVVSVSVPIASRTVRDFFLSENGDVFKAMPSNKRSEMLAYYDVGRLMPTTDNFGGSFTLQKVTESYISVKASESSDIQLKMLTSGRDTTLLVINTVKIPAKDSRLRAFDTSWNEVKLTKAVKQAKMEDFIVIPKGSKKKKADVLGEIRFPIISYVADSVTTRIVAHQELKSFMSDDDYKQIEPYLKGEIVVKK